jgi:hypothetical protein
MYIDFKKTGLDKWYNDILYQYLVSISGCKKTQNNIVQRVVLALHISSFEL